MQILGGWDIECRLRNHKLITSNKDCSTCYLDFLDSVWLRIKNPLLYFLRIFHLTLARRGDKRTAKGRATLAEGRQKVAKVGRIRYCSGGESPRVLPHHLAIPILIFKLNVEHLRKVLAQTMRGGSLNASPGGWDKRLET